MQPMLGTLSGKGSTYASQRDVRSASYNRNCRCSAARLISKRPSGLSDGPGRPAQCGPQQRSPFKVSWPAPLRGALPLDSPRGSNCLRFRLAGQVNLSGALHGLEPPAPLRSGNEMPGPTLAGLCLLMVCYHALRQAIMGWPTASPTDLRIGLLLLAPTGSSVEITQ